MVVVVDGPAVDPFADMIDGWRVWVVEKSWVAWWRWPS